MSLARWLALAAAAALAAGCAAPAEEDADESDGALIGGTEAKAGQFPATVHLEAGCTAAKVAPRMLLTAAHCVLDPATVSVLYGEGSTISLSADPATGYAAHEVAKVHVHPSWLSACDETYCGAASVTAKLDAPDVAVIELARDLDDVPEAVVDPTPLRSGDRVTILGYGCTEGVHRPDARARASLAWAEARIVPADRALHEGSPVSTKDVPVFSRLYAQTPGPALSGAGLCPGDSGGPLYAERDGALVVVGVNSNYTLAPESDDAAGLPVTNWHTRLDGGSRHDVAAWLAAVGAIPAARR